MKSVIFLFIIVEFVFAAADSSAKTADTMVVQGKRPERSKVNVKTVENLVGKSDDLNNLIFLQPSVARVPEAGSLMLVQGDGYYDNRYYLNNIPVYTLSHFSGQVFADRSIVSLTTANDVHLETQGIAGRYTGASGSVLTIVPALRTGKGQDGMPFPELALNYGTLGADIGLKVPFHKINNYYEVTVRPSNRYDMLSKDVIYSSEPNVGLSSPCSYDDVQVHGIQKASRFDVEELIYAGRDNYAVGLTAQSLGLQSVFRYQEKSIPWGIAVVSLKDNSPARFWNINVGGSGQYSFEGKLLADFSPLVSVYNRNFAFSFDTKPPRFQTQKSSLSLRISSEAARWDGNVSLRRQLRPEIYGKGEYQSPLYSDSSVLSQEGVKGTVAAHAGYTRFLTSNLTLGMDGNTGLFLCGTKGFFDPALSLQYTYGKLSLIGQGGIISSQPDSRGMPSPSYAQRVIHTYRGDVTASVNALSWLSFSLDSYAKLKDHVPQKSLQALSPVWDESNNAHGRAYGGTLSLDAKPWKKLRVWSSVYLSKSTVYGRDGAFPSEWEVPWTLKNVVSYSFLKDNLRVYAIGNYSEGMAYRNLIDNNGALVWDNRVSHAPHYKSMDIKVEYCQPIAKYEWHVLQFDGYILATNVLHADNIREYYWDSKFNKKPIFLDYGIYYLGARVIVRL